MYKKKNIRYRNLEPAKQSKLLLIELAPSAVGMFRFLLEAYENLAYFSVINKDKALLKLVFSPHMEKSIQTALDEISISLPIKVSAYPASTLQNI